MSITIYGASDDLIEIEGDINAEFNVYEQTGRLAVSDGTLVVWEYNDAGMWRFHPHFVGSEYNFRLGLDADTDYSDRLTLDADIVWVALASDWVVRTS